MLELVWNQAIINPMINILLLVYSVVGNFGIAIILFTILIRLITHPLTAQQVKSQSVMQEMQKSPEYQEIQKKYKDDKQKLQQEQMRLYQEKGINPLGGCLPLLIQFPIIIGLYQAIIRVLAVAPVQLSDLSRHVYPFINVAKLVPVNDKFLWMNLSQPERLYIFGIGIPVLAVLVVGTTYLQQKLMMPAGQPGDQGAQMSKMMNLYMPFFMGYLALTFAAGLSLYFITGNVISIAQYAKMGKVDWSNLKLSKLLPSFMKKGSPEAAPAALDTPKKTSSPVKSSSSKSGSSSSKKGKSTTKK